MLLRALPLMAGPRPSAATAIAAGNRNRVPTTNATSPNTNAVRAGCIRVTAPLCGLTTLEGAWGNYSALSAGGESATGLPAFNLTLALDYPVGQTTRQRITIGGQDTTLMNPNDLKFQDVLAVNIPGGAVYDVYWQKETLGTGGGTYTILTNQFYGPARGDRLTSTTSTADRTLTGTIPAVAALTADYGPLLLFGQPASAPTCVHIFGDSRAWGSGDKTGTTSQGDYFAGTSPTPPYINIGNTGWIERGIGGRHGLFNMAVPGRAAGAFTEALNPKTFAVAAKTRPTHLILEASGNDLIASGAGATTAENVVLRNQAVQAYYRAKFPGVKVGWTTSSPVANSSNGWTDLGGQSLSGSVGGIPSPNWANSLPGQLPELFDNVGAATSTASTATFSGGTDGVATITSTVLVGLDTVPRKGMYALRGTGASVAMLADADDSTQWTSQVAYGLSEGTYMVMTGPAGDTISAAVAAKATAGIDSYAAKLLFGDWVYFSDALNGQVRLVSPQGFAAGKLAALSPEQSGLNKPLNGVVGTQKSSAQQQYSNAELQALAQAGIDIVCNPAPGGSYFALRMGRNASSNAVTNGDNYTRMTNYIASTVNAGMGRFIGETITPDERRQAKATLDSFFSAMKQLRMIDDWLVVLDATNNTPNREALGYQQADCKVRYLSIVSYLVCNLEGGTSVTTKLVSSTPA